MSKDCYVKQYKGSVSADLEKYDVLTLEVLPNMASTEVDLRKFYGHKMSWDGDVVVTVGGVQQTSPIVISATSFVSSGANGGNIEIDGKYSMDYALGSNLNMLSPVVHPKFFDSLSDMASWWQGDISSGGNLDMSDKWHIKGTLSDLTKFAHKDTLTTISLMKCGIEGKLSDLPTITVATAFNVASCPVSGNISDLGGWTSLTSLNLDSTGVTGTIESLIAAQRAAGRTTGSIKIYASNTSITYNGSAAGTHTYTWDAQGNITVSA